MAVSSWRQCGTIGEKEEIIAGWRRWRSWVTTSQRRRVWHNSSGRPEPEAFQRYYTWLPISICTPYTGLPTATLPYHIIYTYVCVREPVGPHSIFALSSILQAVSETEYNNNNIIIIMLINTYMCVCMHLRVRVPETR